MWFILMHRIVTHRRSRWFHQFLVFLSTGILMFMMIRVGIYKI